MNSGGELVEEPGGEHYNVYPVLTVAIIVYVICTVVFLTHDVVHPCVCQSFVFAGCCLPVS